jgi:hypothetical protein
MRLNSVVLLMVFQLSGLAQDKPSLPLAGQMPKEIETEEQVILLSARLKTLAEVQDLLLKQQQLILQHLEGLRADVESLKGAQTNGMNRSEWQDCLNRVDELQKQVQQVQSSNRWVAAKLTEEAVRPAAGTNDQRGFHFESYKVLPGDTLSKIVVRVNDTLERRNLARVSQEQVERANPGVNADKIRVGQTLLIPLLEKP